MGQGLGVLVVIMWNWDTQGLHEIIIMLALFPALADWHSQVYENNLHVF